MQHCLSSNYLTNWSQIATKSLCAIRPPCSYLKPLQDSQAMPSSDRAIPRKTSNTMLRPLLQIGRDISTHGGMAVTTL
jgi:hypothetical protein